jgi:hypothetical protein
MLDLKELISQLLAYLSMVIDELFFGGLGPFHNVCGTTCGP